MKKTKHSRLQIEHVDVEKLLPWEKNPRENEQAVGPVAKSIKQFGFNVPILCNKDYRIIAGHTRWMAARNLGLRQVPVVQLNLSRRDEAAFSIAENKTGELADWDTPKLKEILDELHAEDLDLGNLGFSNAQLDALLTSRQDFPWDEFDNELAADAENPYAQLIVKLPRAKLDFVKKRVAEFALRRRIRNKDKAKVAGDILMTALGMRDSR